MPGPSGTRTRGASTDLRRRPGTTRTATSRTRRAPRPTPACPSSPRRDGGSPTPPGGMATRPTRRPAPPASTTATATSRTAAPAPWPARPPEGRAPPRRQPVAQHAHGLGGVVLGVSHVVSHVGPGLVGGVVAASGEPPCGAPRLGGGVPGWRWTRARSRPTSRRRSVWGAGRPPMRRPPPTRWPAPWRS